MLEATSLTMMQDAISVSPGPVVWSLSRFVTQADISDENRATARRLRTALTGGPASGMMPLTALPSATALPGPVVQTPLWGLHAAGECVVPAQFTASVGTPVPVCACVHVCMCACVHVCMCARVHVCTWFVSDRRWVAVAWSARGCELVVCSVCLCGEVALV